MSDELKSAYSMFRNCSKMKFCELKIKTYGPQITVSFDRAWKICGSMKILRLHFGSNVSIIFDSELIWRCNSLKKIEIIEYPKSLHAEAIKYFTESNNFKLFYNPLTMCDTVNLSVFINSNVRYAKFKNDTIDCGFYRWRDFVSGSSKLIHNMEQSNFGQRGLWWLCKSLII